MNHYDDIKAAAVKIFPLRAQSQAAYQAKNYKEALDYAHEFKESAASIFNNWPNMLSAAVVYINASTFYSQLLSKFKDCEMDVLDEIYTCMLNTKDLLAPRRLDDENCCQLLLSQMASMMGALFSIASSEKYQEIQEVNDMLSGVMNMFYNLYHSLERINPNSKALQAHKGLLQNIQNMGFEPDPKFPSHFIGGFDFLGLKYFDIKLFSVFKDDIHPNN